MYYAKIVINIIVLLFYQKQQQCRKINSVLMLCENLGRTWPCVECWKPWQLGVINEDWIVATSLQKKFNVHTHSKKKPRFSYHVTILNGTALGTYFIVCRFSHSKSLIFAHHNNVCNSSDCPHEASASPTPDIQSSFSTPPVFEPGYRYSPDQPEQMSTELKLPCQRV